MYSNGTILYYQPSMIELGAKLVEGRRIQKLQSQFYDLRGLRTLTYLDNLAKCNELKRLMHPIISGPSIDDLLDDSHEVVALLEHDHIIDLAFMLRDENVNSVMYQMVFTVIGKLQKLKKLKISEIAASCTTNIEILNNSLGRVSQIEDLEVNFTHRSGGMKGSSTAIKFHKYLKKLKRLKLSNVWHRDFTESLFDMASQRHLQELDLSFVQEVPLPNFCEALQIFRRLQRLSLTSLNFNKINESIFIEFLKNAPNLQSLCLDSVEVSNQFGNILKAFRQSETLSELRLANIAIQNSATRREQLQDFVGYAYQMHKCSLETNKLANVDFLSLMYLNRSLLELELID